MESIPNITINLNDAAAARVLTENPLKIEYRKAPARKILDEVAPQKTMIEGTLGSVREYLEKRIGTLDEKKAHILVDRENVKISLIIDEDNGRGYGYVVGRLIFDPRFEAFGINNAQATWEPVGLAMFMKMHRSFFVSKEENMTYVSTLMNYKATIEQKVERSRNEKGDMTDNFQQIVNSNLPKAFHLSIPIFKGYPKEDIEVETFASVDGRSIAFVLLSPGANDTLEALRDKAIDEELAKINDIFASHDVVTIPIIEL